jgi:hypothetical protein
MNKQSRLEAIVILAGYSGRAVCDTKDLRLLKHLDRAFESRISERDYYVFVFCVGIGLATGLSVQ